VELIAFDLLSKVLSRQTGSLDAVFMFNNSLSVDHQNTGHYAKMAYAV
jgi:hypothetical protein